MKKLSYINTDRSSFSINTVFTIGALEEAINKKHVVRLD